MAKARTSKGSAIAVLTGDLVRSSSLSAADLSRARAAIEHAGQEISDWAPNLTVGPVEFFRGDAWQLALGDVRFFLRAAIYIRGKLRAERIDFDSRIGIGLGRFEEIHGQRTSLSIGEAFTISGRTLDSMIGMGGISVDLPDRAERRLGWVKPLVFLCSAVADHWTERQADWVARMLERPAGMQQNELAVKLAIAKQTLSKGLAAADFSPLSAAIDYVEAFDWAAELTQRTTYVKI